MSEARAPYPGLRPFREDEHPFFFGRCEHTAALYRLLDRGRFLAVLGGSGSGKSSLVQAGLLPLLREEKRPEGAARWVIVALRPGTHPVNRLATALLKVARSDSETIPRVASGLRRSSHGLAEEVGRLLSAGSEVLILVDQFEELFRYADAKSPEETGNRDPGAARLAQDDESRRFVEVLLTASALAKPRVRVILTMRSDFLGDSARYRGFAEAVSANQYLTPWLHRDQQTEAIVGPLMRHAGRLKPDVLELTETHPKDWSDLIEPQLVEQLKNDAGDDPDQLPVLQHALVRCWQKASGGRLTMELYRSRGGWGVILSNHADEIMQICGEDRASTVERIFRALTERDRAGRAIRRPRTIAQLVAETGDKENDIRAVISRFSAPDCSFLVPPTPPDELVDIGHEALIRQWGKIADTGAGWLQKEFRDGLIWQSLLVQVEDFRKNPKDVLSPAATEERERWLQQHSQSWAERYGDQWPAVERLVRASVRARDWSRRIKIGAAVVLLAAAAGLAFDQWQRAQQAERQRIEAVATSIGFQLELQDGDVERRDVEALMALAGAGRDERLAFVTELIRRPALAERFARNPAVATRALVGLDPVARRQVIAHAFGPAAVTPENPGSRYARALLGIELATAEAAAPVLDAMKGSTDPDALRALGQGLAALPVELTAEQAEQAIASVLTAMAGTTDPDALRALGQGLAALAAKLTAEQARQATLPILAAMKGSTDPDALRALGQGLAALPVELTAEQALQATLPILAAMKGSTDPDALRALGQGLAELAAKLTAEQARQAIEPVLAAMTGTTDPAALQALGERLAELAAKLTAEQALQATLPILAAMKGTTDPAALQALGERLAELAAKLTAEQARQAIETVLAAMKGSTDPDALRALGQGLAELAAKLTAEQARQAIETVLAAMKGTTEPAALRALGEGLAALPVELTAEQARQATLPILTAMTRTTEPAALRALGEGLAALAPKLTAEQAVQAIEPVLAAMKGTTEPAALRALSRGLAALPVELTAEQARQTIEPVLATMRGTTDQRALWVLGQGLAALAAKLTAEQARQAIETVLAAMKRTTDPFVTIRFLRLNEPLSALAAKLTAEQARQAIETVLAAMKGTTEPAALRALGQGLAALAPKLTAEQAVQAIEPVLAAMKGTTAPAALRALGEGLAALAAKLTAEQARQATLPILAAMKGTTDPDALRALGQGLAALAAKLTAEQARQAIETVLAAMKGTTDPDALQALGERLAALPVELTAEQAEQAIASVLAAMTGTTDPDALRALGQGLAALAAKLTAEQARQATLPILAAMTGTTDPDALRALGEGLAALAAKLTAELARQAIEPVLAAMKGTTAPDALRALGERLAELAAKLTDERAVQSLVDAMKIPWMAGAPGEPLLRALEEKLAGYPESSAGVWDVVAQIQQRFGKAVDLTTPPKVPDASGGV